LNLLFVFWIQIGERVGRFVKRSMKKG
jgi:hypothetical protein